MNVKIPNVDFKNGVEDLLKFYKELGWDGEKELEPTKVIINREVAKTFMENLESKYTEISDKISAGMAWVSYGPSSDDDIKPNQVKLLKGWIGA